MVPPSCTGWQTFSFKVDVEVHSREFPATLTREVGFFKVEVQLKIFSDIWSKNILEFKIKNILEMKSKNISSGLKIVFFLP